jgi:hypothetical protein
MHQGRCQPSLTSDHIAIKSIFQRKTKGVWTSHWVCPSRKYGHHTRRKSECLHWRACASKTIGKYDYKSSSAIVYSWSVARNHESAIGRWRVRGRHCVQWMGKYKANSAYFWRLEISSAGTVVLPVGWLVLPTQAASKGSKSFETSTRGFLLWL